MAMATAYAPTYHPDGSVTFWDVYLQQWVRSRVAPRDEVLASFNQEERVRVVLHTARLPRGSGSWWVVEAGERGWGRDARHDVLTRRPILVSPHVTEAAATAAARRRNAAQPRPAPGVTARDFEVADGSRLDTYLSRQECGRDYDTGDVPRLRRDALYQWARARSDGS